MTDPWDDAGRSQAGIVVTAGGLRVPVCAPAPLGGRPADGSGLPNRRARGRNRSAGYRGVGPKGYQRSDSRLKEQVCEQLLLDPYLDPSGIVVKVSKGPRRAHRHRAERTHARRQRLRRHPAWPPVRSTQASGGRRNRARLARHSSRVARQHAHAGASGPTRTRGRSTMSSGANAEGNPRAS